MAAETAQPPPTEPVTELAPMRVTATGESRSRLVVFLEKLGLNKASGPFIDVRGAPLIEAIIWRHRFVEEHPLERATIVIDRAGDWVRSATTVYTEEGRLFASNQWLGDHYRLKDFTAADLGSAKVAAKIKEMRTQLYESAKSKLNDPDTNGFPPPALPEGVVDAALPSPPPPPPELFEDEGIVYAEETGDYSILNRLAETGLGASDGFQGTGMTSTRAHAFRDASNDVILDRVNAALHNRDEAGVIPVTRARVDFIVDQWGGGTKKVAVDAVVFDWEGVHYAYDPSKGRGVYGLAFPRNPLTGRPYLVVKHGEKLECIYFAMTYHKVHPEEKVVFLDGEHPAVACTSGGRVHFFIPVLGHITAPAKSKIDDPAALIEVVTTALAQKSGGVASAGPAQGGIATEMPGDDAVMQMRRVWLALEEAGIPVKVDGAALFFEWKGARYRYDTEGCVRLS